MPKKKLHPVVEEYIRTDRKLLSICLESTRRREPIVAGMIAIMQAHQGIMKQKEARRIVSDVELKNTDPNLLIMFVSHWALMLLGDNPDKARLMMKRAHGMDSPRILPQVRSHLLMIEGYVCERLGNYAAREKLLPRMLELWPEDAPRRRHFVWDKLRFLAMFGRLDEAPQDLAVLESHARDGDSSSMYAQVRFINCVETGRTDDAEAAFRQITADHEGRSGQTRFRRIVLDLMQDKGEFSPPQRLSVMQGTGRLSPHEWLAPVYFLLRREPVRALAWSRRALTAPFPRDIFHTPVFAHFNPVRAELASGHGHAALRLLDKYQETGFHHYLGDFFRARAELLCGGRDEAVHRIGAALQAIERYGAWGRLNFELRMAHELEPGTLARLVREASRGTRQERAPAPSKAARPEQAPTAPRIVGASPALEGVKDLVTRFAPLDAPVLITGETGTGKELAARTLHDTGPRRGGPFLAVNCGAIPEPLLESELFGHERGAFTGAEEARRGVFEEAGTGSLLLDEIGEIVPRLQVSLLRVLDSGEIRPVGSSRTRKISCRIIAATNAPLDRLEKEGGFRKDLLFRLRRLEIRIPPVRERREDILPLAFHWLNEGRRDGRQATMTSDLQAALRDYDWPGNVREIRNEVERMRLLNSDALDYGLEHLDARIRAAVLGPAAAEAEAGADGPPEPDARPVLTGGRSKFRRQENAMRLFEKHRRMTRMELAQALGVSLSTATNDLKELCEKGGVRKVEPTASPRTHYFEWAGSHDDKADA